ncbi:hypothetical protein [Chamaesiphon sp. VAR_69_metabat_338]|uniref:hypothetical protein n=1 Tax=Chamaesiphon sp. VAR_69_metabat_338 TaxID=2964704 RepID=UPI00286E886F|nr:hypothetical protein [Chamaesiphon sp. VAR_69_metabat_338]
MPSYRRILAYCRSFSCSRVPIDTFILDWKNQVGTMRYASDRFAVDAWQHVLRSRFE